jgi:NADH-quinone oxidoreductase subunit F
MGTERSPGNFLCGISGHVERPGVYEVPLGMPARVILDEVAGGVWRDRTLKAWFPGGSSTGLLPADAIDTPMDHESVKGVGSMFGTGAMIVLDETACVARASLVIARFYDHESCGQCSQCREGTQWLSQIFERLCDGRGRMEDLDLLQDLAGGMTPAKTICALSDAAAIPVQTVLRHFREELEEHVRRGGCAYHAAVLQEAGA